MNFPSFAINSPINDGLLGGFPRAGNGGFLNSDVEKVAE
jgi:hypothetical protein